MEVLRQADPGKSNIKKIKRLYRILQRKQLNQVLRKSDIAVFIFSLLFPILCYWFSVLLD